MKTVLCMYVTLFPVILTGACNMIWCKLPFLKSLQRPIDGGRNFIDGKRLFGANKTWKGFIGYVVLSTVITVLWGLLCGHTALGTCNFFYFFRTNTVGYNAGVGALLGFAYALFELPNSFLKRRFDIAPGRPPEGAKKIFFVFLDQADSIFGCVLVLCMFYPMSAAFYFCYILLGALTHIVVNLLLYALKLRKNMF